MSEFQLGLLIIGVVVVIAVVAFNKWQEIRYRRQSEAALQPQSVDALLEPSGADQDGAAPPVIPPERQTTGSDGGERSEPSFGPSPSKVAQTAPASQTVRAPIDLVITVGSEAGISLSDFRAEPLDEGMTRRIGVEALIEGSWEKLREDMRYPQVNIRLQLVNRTGPVSSADLDQFGQWIGEFTGRTGATHEPVDLAAARHAAVELDRFCGEADILIAVHVVAGANQFPGTRIRAIAEAAGLAIEPNGIFRKRDDEGRELFRLANEGGDLFQAETMRELVTKSVVLEFDVARAPGGNHAFNKFRQFAEHLASGLGGKVVDDNRAPLGAAGFDAIGKELAGVYQAMTARGIAPGSPESQRLFS